MPLPKTFSQIEKRLHIGLLHVETILKISSLGAETDIEIGKVFECMSEIDFPVHGRKVLPQGRCRSVDIPSGKVFQRPGRIVPVAADLIVIVPQFAADPETAETTLAVRPDPVERLPGRSLDPVVVLAIAPTAVMVDQYAPLAVDVLRRRKISVHHALERNADADFQVQRAILPVVVQTDRHRFNRRHFEPVADRVRMNLVSHLGTQRHRIVHIGFNIQFRCFVHGRFVIARHFHLAVQIPFFGLLRPGGTCGHRRCDQYDCFFHHSLSVTLKSISMRPFSAAPRLRRRHSCRNSRPRYFYRWLWPGTRRSA